MKQLNLALVLLITVTSWTPVCPMPQRQSSPDFSDEEILRALSRLLATENGSDRDRENKDGDGESRKGRVIGEDFSFKSRDQLNNEEKRLMNRVESERQSMLQ